MASELVQGMLYRSNHKISGISVTDAYVQKLIIDTLGCIKKGFVIRETGNSNGLTYKIEGSIDPDAKINNVPSDLLTVKAEATVAAGGDTGLLSYDDAYNIVVVSVKNTVAGSNATAQIECLCE